MDEKPTYPKPANKTKESSIKSTTYRSSVSNASEPNQNAVETASRALAIPDQISDDLQALDEEVKSMMERTQRTIQNGKKADGTPQTATSFICKVCGKEGTRIHIRNHIEAHHMQKISVPCNHCDKVFSSRGSLDLHKSRFHK